MCGQGCVGEVMPGREAGSSSRFCTFGIAAGNQGSQGENVQRRRKRQGCCEEGRGLQSSLSPGAA